MLVYGDAVRREAPSVTVAAIRRFLDEAEAASGIRRHERLVAALIEAGGLAQGIADAAFHARGDRDGRNPATDAAMEIAMRLAGLVVASWASGFLAIPERGGADAALGALDLYPLPAALDVKQPEGFALYAVYPEAYAEAAAGLAEGPVTVVGIRSIGTALAAVVAASIGAGLPVTVRPVGHPYSRELATEPALDAELAEAVSGAFAVVDEGPGQSGSSFLAVARHLQGLGAAPRDVHLFPSHGNPPGAKAPAETHADWQEHPRHLRSTDEILFAERAPGGGLAGWVTDLVGPPLEPLRDLSGGGWRQLRFANEAEWPPVHAWQERRKYLCRTASGTWLLRFAGLGRDGLAKGERGRELAAAGFVPEIAGWRHGFLVERWHGQATLPDTRGPGRPAFTARLGRYLGFRAAAFPSGPGSGASLEALRDMAIYNTGQALGPEAADSVGRLLANLPDFGPRLRRIATDNRLQGWEWLEVEGAILKADALDHCAGHDLVGCQDAAWDIAGAAVEFGLGEAEVDDVLAAVEAATARPADGELVRMLAPCYLAFQLGYHTMAATSAPELDRARLMRRSERYAADLARRI